MGYHVIIRSSDEGIVSRYVENLEDIANISDITEDSIVYEGEPHWTPIRVGNSERYKTFCEEWFRAGIKAQRLFKEQAVVRGLIVEDLSQDQGSFQAYSTNSTVPIKRGDYLIRNARNTEIETKCLTYYSLRGIDAIHLPYHDVMKHKNMQSFTNCPIIIAFYRRDGDSPESDSLRMIRVDTILEENNRTVEYSEENKTLIIPVSLSLAGFEIIDQIQEQISQELL